MNITKYIKMKERGATPQEVLLEIQNDGLPLLKQLDIIKKTFSLSIVETKEILVTADGGAKSLAEHQGNILDSLIKANKGGTVESLIEEIDDEMK